MTDETEEPFDLTPYVGVISGIERIAITPGTVGGAPRIKGTGLTVDWLVKKLRAGVPIEEVCMTWRITADDIAAAQAFQKAIDDGVIDPPEGRSTDDFGFGPED